MDLIDKSFKKDQDGRWKGTFHLEILFNNYQIIKFNRFPQIYRNILQKRNICDINEESH